MTKFARILNEVAVDVAPGDPAQFFAPDLAALFVSVPDEVEPGWVRVAEIVGESTTANSVWMPPRTYVEEFAAGRSRYQQRSAPPAPVFAGPAQTREITKLAFRNRFTSGEKVTIELAAADNPAAAIGVRQASAFMRANLADQRDATFIDLTRADTRAGVQALEAAGVIGPGRALVILDAPIQPTEAYTG